MRRGQPVQLTESQGFAVVRVAGRRMLRNNGRTATRQRSTSAAWRNSAPRESDETDIYLTTRRVRVRESE